MTRVKGGKVARVRRKKVLKQAKGYFGSKHRLFKTAQEQVFHSGAYAYRDRKQNKRNFRKLWITRINAACRENNISYSQFINGLNKAGIMVNRKMLSELAIDNPDAFKNLVTLANDGLSGKIKLKETPVPKEEVKKETPKPKAKEEVKEEVPKSEEKPTKDYSKMTLPELKTIAKEQGLKNISTMKKADLIKNLK